MTVLLERLSVLAIMTQESLTPVMMTLFASVSSYQCSGITSNKG